MTTPVTVLERIEVLMEKHFTTIEKMMDASQLEKLGAIIKEAYNQGYEKGKLEADLENSV